MKLNFIRIFPKLFRNIKHTVRTAAFRRDVTYTQWVPWESGAESKSRAREPESGSCALCRSSVVAPGLATRLFQGYFIWLRISGCVQFHLRRLAQRSIAQEIWPNAVKKKYEQGKRRRRKPQKFRYQNVNFELSYILEVVNELFRRSKTWRVNSEKWFRKDLVKCCGTWALAEFCICRR